MIDLGAEPLTNKIKLRAATNDMIINIAII